MPTQTHVYMKCFWATRVAGKIRGKKVGIFPPFFYLKNKKGTFGELFLDFR